MEILYLVSDFEGCLKFWPNVRSFSDRVYDLNALKILIFLFLLCPLLDRFAIQNIPKQLDECDFVADIGFLIDASNSIREDYLSELQFVKLVAAR